MYTTRKQTIWTQQLDGLEKSQPEAVAVAREILECEGYNGWVNQETCLVALNLSSDYELYNQTLAKIEDARSTSEAAVFIERWVKEHHSILHHEQHNRVTQKWANLLADAGSLWRVDWQAVVDHFID